MNTGGKPKSRLGTQELAGSNVLNSTQERFSQCNAARPDETKSS
jgi:hypothetical protein